MAMAILLTVTSNLLAVFTLPLTLPLALSGARSVLAGGGGCGLGAGAGAAVSAGLQLDPGALLQQLVAMVLVPTLVGASIRAWVPGGSVLLDYGHPDPLMHPLPLEPCDTLFSCHHGCRSGLLCLALGSSSCGC